MQERRRTARTRVVKGARIVIDQQHPIDCTVCDLSTRGACLQITSPGQYPQSFDLSFDSFRSIRRCEVKWRATDRLGVAFCYEMGHKLVEMVQGR